MERLLKAMVCPDHHKRLTASQAHRHVALQPQHKADHLSTPPFVRTATGLHDHQAKRRREPQPKAKLPKRDHVRREACSDPRAGGDSISQIQPTQQVTEIRSDARNEQVTPRKKTHGNIIVVTPTASQAPTMAEKDHVAVAVEEPEDASKPNPMSGERPRANAMTTIEALRKAKPLEESTVHNESVSSNKISGRYLEVLCPYLPPLRSLLVRQAYLRRRKQRMFPSDLAPPLLPFDVLHPCWV